MGGNISTDASIEPIGQELAASLAEPALECKG